MRYFNEKKIMYAFENIKKFIEENYIQYHLSLAWLLNFQNRNAILIVCQKEKHNDMECLLFNTDGKILYQQHYNDSTSDSYHDVIDFFLINETDCFELDIIKLDKQKYNTLIIDTHTNLQYLYKYCREFSNIEESLSGNTLKEIKYVCSIFKLNQLCKIESDDVPTTFYLRYSIVNDNNEQISYYDIEYKVNENEDFLFIDEFILDVKHI